MGKRKIIQIAASESEKTHCVVALCDDGSLWGRPSDDDDREEAYFCRMDISEITGDTNDEEPESPSEKNKAFAIVLQMAVDDGDLELCGMLQKKLLELTKLAEQ